MCVVCVCVCIGNGHIYTGNVGTPSTYEPLFAPPHPAAPRRTPPALHVHHVPLSAAVEKHREEEGARRRA